MLSSSLQKLPYGVVAALTGVMAFPVPTHSASSEPTAGRAAATAGELRTNADDATVDATTPAATASSESSSEIGRAHV